MNNLCEKKCIANIKKSLGMEMRSLNNLVTRKIADKAGLTEDNMNMTFMHGKIAEFLYMNQDKEVFQRDIERAFEMRRPTVTKLLQSMEKRGLIKRCGVDYDARLKQVMLTEKAMNLQDEMVQMFSEFEADLINNLTDDELQVLFNILDKVKQNLVKI